MSKRLRIAFIHPDLGIGGAERLVVDAAVALKAQGHQVHILTSRHDPKRCFVETVDVGTLPVHVLGSSLPRHLHSRLPMTIIFSILRSLLLSILFLTSLLLPGPPSLLNPLSPMERFDVFIVDQQAVSIPLLRLVSGTRVVFYCHFPDKLLSGKWEIDIRKDTGYVKRKKGTSLVQRVYRWPIDKLEEYTISQADVILSNSQFSSRVFGLAFSSLASKPRRVVYPCIDVDAYQATPRLDRKDHSVKVIQSDRPTIVSFNRFEAKKNIALAIRAFAELRNGSYMNPSEFNKLRFVIGGGYDQDERDNTSTLSSLQQLCSDLELSFHTIASISETFQPPATVQIIFLLNFSNAQRTHLLTAPSTRCLVYTPENEHFGIVPIEAGAAGLVVLGCDSGGPVETIVDFSSSSDGLGSGLLRPSTPKAWAEALNTLISLTPDKRKEISEFARQRTRSEFSLSTLGMNMEKACRDALSLGDLHEQLGDHLIKTSLGLIGLSIGGLGVIWLIWGGSL
nr:alpha-1,3/alpha-1,6-mannosyltransferase [Cryptococcus depauperatus CBS 7841]